MCVTSYVRNMIDIIFKYTHFHTSRIFFTKFVVYYDTNTKFKKFKVVALGRSNPHLHQASVS